MYILLDNEHIIQYNKGTKLVGIMSTATQKEDKKIAHLELSFILCNINKETEARRNIAQPQFLAPLVEYPPLSENLGVLQPLLKGVTIEVLPRCVAQCRRSDDTNNNRDDEFHRISLFLWFCTVYLDRARLLYYTIFMVFFQVFEEWYSTKGIANWCPAKFNEG